MIFSSCKGHDDVDLASHGEVSHDFMISRDYSNCRPRGLHAASLSWLENNVAYRAYVRLFVLLTCFKTHQTAFLSRTAFVDW